MTENYFYIKNVFLRIIKYIIIFIFVGGFSIAISSENEAALKLNESQLSKLKDEEILVYVRRTEGQQKGMVEALVLIDAAAENIWKIMTDCPGAPTFVPGLKNCRVLDSGQNWEIIRHEVKWIWLLPRISYIFRADYRINRRIDFVKIKGDLREMKGSWRLFPLEEKDQTIVHYEVYLDPSFFIPQWLVERSLMTDLPDMLAALRTKVRNSVLDRKPHGTTHDISVGK
jgi:ribosome-associated toxin RatA of RatAB toxin-antitoxin module